MDFFGKINAMLNALLDHLRVETRSGSSGKRSPGLFQRAALSPLPRIVTPSQILLSHNQSPIRTAGTSGGNTPVKCPTINIDSTFSGSSRSSPTHGPRLQLSSPFIRSGKNSPVGDATTSSIINLWKRKVPTNGRLLPLAFQKKKQRSGRLRKNGDGGEVDFAGVVGQYIQSSRLGKSKAFTGRLNVSQEKQSKQSKYVHLPVRLLFAYIHLITCSQ